MTFPSSQKKEHLTKVLTEIAKTLREQDVPGAPVAASPVPSSPVPPSPVTNAGSEPPVPGSEPAQPTDPSIPKVFDIDTMIDRLNMIRAGKSFADPEVYGQLTSFFKTLNETDKAIIDKFLKSINQIVIQVAPTQTMPPQATAQPPMNQQPGAAPAIATSPTPVPMAETLLHESLKPGVKFAINGRNFDIGSPDHLRILAGILKGLRSLRDCHQMGTANRHVYSAASARLRKHMESLMKKSS